MPLRAANPLDRTKRFYETNPSAYSEATSKRDLENTLAEFARSLHAGAWVLDLGCGAGHDLISFRRHLMDPVGLDYAEPMARLARRMAHVPVVVADMRELPFPSGTFAGVWASASLHHLSQSDLARALAECRRILAARGRFFASVKRGCGELVDDRGRYFLLQEKESWANALATAGFNITSLQSNDSVASHDDVSEVTRWLNSLAVAA